MKFWPPSGEIVALYAPDGEHTESDLQQYFRYQGIQYCRMRHVGKHSPNKLWHSRSGRNEDWLILDDRVNDIIPNLSPDIIIAIDMWASNDCGLPIYQFLNDIFSDNEI